jgi:DNA-binding XRE family transcriptional regulator
MRAWDVARAATPKDFAVLIRKRLKEAREASGMTQAQLAKEIGVSESAYAKYENRSPLPAHLVPKVCVALSMDCWWFLTGRFVQDHLRAGDGPFEPGGRRHHSG